MVKKMHKISDYQCEATTFQAEQCSFGSRYDIDGIKLCHQHAGPVTIQKLININQCFKLEITGVAGPDSLCKMETKYDYWKI